jgi:phosphatidylserine/phosphatidylglycerophosphate/cardiolipin synthase-like enzyme
MTVVFGDDFRLSESEALSILMGLGCQLRLHSSEAYPGFHPKIWIIDYSDGKRAVVIGSSNLSRGGLMANAEANVVLEGAVEELAIFDELWQAFILGSRVFSYADLENYVDSERTIAVPNRTTITMWSVPVSVDLIRNHIERWQRFIMDPYRIGQAERWRGWYLVPEQGQLTPEKLVELANVLNVMMARPQFVQDHVIAFGTDSTGVANAVAVLQGAGITAQHTFTDRHRRDLFIRQQKLYLQTFGFIRQVEPHTFEITTAGAAFARAQSAVQRIRLFTDALSHKQWPFGPINFYPFLCHVIDRVPERRLYFDEMSLIVIHTYHQAELEGIVNLVAAYRRLSDNLRNSLAMEADHRLRELLAQYAGGTAYGRYRRKVADLMVAFGSTVGFQYIEAATEDRSYIKRTT